MEFRKKIRRNGRKECPGGRGSSPEAPLRRQKKRGGSSFRQNALHADRRARAAGAPRRIPLALSPLIMYSLSLTWQV